MISPILQIRQKWMNNTMAICWNRLDKVGGIIGCNILFRNTFWFNYLVLFRPEEKEEIALQLWNGINFDLKSKIRKQALPGVFDLYVKFKSQYINTP